MIVLLPIKVTINDNGTIAEGLSIFYTYLIFGIGFFIQLICIIIDRKHIKSKKYIISMLYIKEEIWQSKN